MKKKKTALVCCGIIVLVFIIYNLFWYVVVYSAYDKYTNGMEEYREKVSYVLHEENYYYNVKYPDYLCFTGNLCVATDDNKYALIIWPSPGREPEYGLQLVDDDGLLYSIPIDKTMNAVDSDYREMVKKYKTNVELLFQKAKDKWM